MAPCRYDCNPAHQILRVCVRCSTLVVHVAVGRERCRCHAAALCSYIISGKPQPYHPCGQDLSLCGYCGDGDLLSRSLSHTQTLSLSLSLFSFVCVYLHAKRYLLWFSVGSTDLCWRFFSSPLNRPSLSADSECSEKT